MLQYALYLFFGFWWGYEVATAETKLSSPRVLCYKELKARMDFNEAARAQPFPDEYRLKMNLADYGNPFNGMGWDCDSGETKAAVALFISDPNRLEVEVAPVKDAKVTPADYEHIQAKIGLEFLTLETSKETPAGRLLVFRGPQRKSYQTGIQVAFIGFVAPAELGIRDSKFRLLQVSWH